jgi:tRNA nucleotidyltransferase/poly(A) polymerase
MRKDKSESQDASPYAGRWVARLNGRVIAHGGTPEQARLAAQKSRHKEKPEIMYMPTRPLSISPLIERVRAALPDEEHYLVGGAVRDALLGRVSHDFDFAIPRKAIPLARRLASVFKADFYVMDESFDIARLILTSAEGVRDVLDFAAFRGADLYADLRGRDFTINAVAFDVQAEALLDPLDGASDLRARIVRACSDSALRDDPVRVLRAVRLAAEFDFKIEAGTRKAMKAAASLLPDVSPERKRDELFRILAGPRPADSLRALDLLNAFPYLLPELPALKGVQQSEPHIHDVWEHTLGTIRYLDELLSWLVPGDGSGTADDSYAGPLTLQLGRYREQLAAHFAKRLNADRSLRALLFFAALYHDVSKPATRSVDAGGRIRFFGHDQRGAQAACERAIAFNLSNDEIERLRSVIAHHMRFHFFVSHMETQGTEPSRRAVYRFFRDAGEAGIDLVLLGLADLRAIWGPTLNLQTWAAALDIAHMLLENYWERPEETVAPPRLVDGRDVMQEYQLEPGPLVGRVLEAIRETQAAGEVSTREEALAFGREWIRQDEK